MVKKRKQKLLEFTLEVSVIPTLLAVIGIGLSTWQFLYNKNQNSLSVASYIGVRVDPYVNNKVKIVKGPSNFEDYMYRKTTKLIFTNNGQKDASIVDWGFYIPLDLEKGGKSQTMKIYMPGLEVSLNEKDGKEIGLPIDIEQGSSIAVYLEYSVGISSSALEKLNLQENDTIGWREIDRRLSSIYNDSNSNEYLAEFLKGNGEEFSIRFTNHGTNGFMQGEKHPDMAEYVR